MQASQSTSAEGKRSFPSPFTAPIQAARRLMERQQQADQSDDLPESASLSGAGHSEGLTGAWLGQLRYDEASIVARLDAGLEAAESAVFEEGLDPAEDFGITDTASGWTTQPSFTSPFVSLGLGLHGGKGPDLRWDRGPDPAAVRAAITRLARESQSKEAGAPKDAVPSNKAAAFADAVAFEDVARRVWSKVDAEEAASPVKEDMAVPETPRLETASSFGPAAPSEAPAASIVTLADEVVAYDPALRNSAVISDGASSPTLLDDAGTSEVNEPLEPIVLGETALAGTARSTEEGECLAHDAGNLLSAMRLYSELLCISGVLQERHRHYADDLKLLATRSQKLIDRLLKLGERLGEPQAGDLAAGRPEAHTEQYLGLTQELHDGVPESILVETEAPDLVPNAPTDIQTYEFEARANLTSETERARIDSAIDLAGEAPQEGTNVAAALERMGNLLQTISHGALRIDLGPDAALPVAIGLEPLERILVNLVCNATAAVQAGGAIRIRAGVQDRDGEGKPGTMVLTVDDSGCGMSPAQVRAILGERDADVLAEGGVIAKAVPREESDLSAGGDSGQPDHDREKSRRRGLGLRIVRGLVAASGGRLFIQSQPGTGTRIEIHWQTLTQPASLLYPAANSALAPLPEAVSFDPAALRKPVGVSRNAVSRIGAGSVAGDRGAVAC